MKKIKYNDFDVEGVVSDVGSKAIILRGVYKPTKMLSSIKVYRPGSVEKRERESEALEKLTETLYVPQLIGVGSTPPYLLSVPVLDEVSWDHHPMNFDSSQPFLAKEWINGYEIFHPYSGPPTENNPQPFKENGKEIIHQHLDFIDKSARRGIYLQNFQDTLWIPDKKLISVIDLANRTA